LQKELSNFINIKKIVNVDSNNTLPSVLNEGGRKESQNIKR